MNLLLSDFDYEFPDELLAVEPLKRRDRSKMMVVNRREGAVFHSTVSELPVFLKKGDLVVMNDTKVFPARLLGKKPTGGKAEILLLDVAPDSDGLFRAISNQTAKLKAGAKILFDKGLETVVAKRDGDVLLVKFNKPRLIEKVGLMPVPPYIRAKRGNKDGEERFDRSRYQTVYAKKVGSAAAPTAGLHFTNALIQKIKKCGAGIAHVTLNVGLDTFSPVRVDKISEHKMHGEAYLISNRTCDAINETRRVGGRVIAVGTTTARALEAFHFERGTPGEWNNTHIFITPGYKFKAVDALFTNFHQPRSTLLMMVSAFAGKELIFDSYKEAISCRYRLFSYGDAMFIV